MGRSGVLKREQLYSEVDAEGFGLCSAPWGPRPHTLLDWVSRGSYRNALPLSGPVGLALNPSQCSADAWDPHRLWALGLDAPFTACRGGWYSVGEGYLQHPQALAVLGAPPGWARMSGCLVPRISGSLAHLSLHWRHPPKAHSFFIKMKNF